MFDMIYVFILSLIISVTAYNISTPRLSKKNIIFLTLTIFILSLLISEFKEFNLLVPVSTAIMIIYFTIIYKKAFYSILVSIFTQIIFALSDALAGVLLVFIFRVNYFQITTDNSLKLITSLIILFFSIVISRVLKAFKKSIYDTLLAKMNKRQICIVSMCLIIALLSIYTYTVTFKKWSFDSSRILILLDLFFISSFFILLVMVAYTNNKTLTRELEIVYKNNELVHLKEYTNMLELLSNDLRKFRHDYNNILQVFGTYLDSNNLEALKEFYSNELMPESKKIINSNLCFSQLQYIKINPLKGLLSSKLILAESRNIKTRVEISEEIGELPIRIIDLCRIIGILFDNAIEAAMMCENKSINLLVCKNINSTSFIISNSCSKDTPPIYKIYEPKFSTKGADRGVGLNNAIDIIAKNSNKMLLNTSVKDFIFTQELVIINEKTN